MGFQGKKLNTQGRDGLFHFSPDEKQLVSSLVDVNVPL